MLAATADAMATLARTPPMGWMSWEVFRCDVDCAKAPNDCIGERLYQTTADAMVAGGYVAAGYDTVHIDDCWEQRSPPRDERGRLAPNATRFPSGMAALARYMHDRRMRLGTYSDEGTQTCGKYPGSKGHERVDASTFAEWGVDYLKLDGCNEPHSAYPADYAVMGAALRASGRPIVFSCSWPAYLGDNETAKPYERIAAAGCNLWRNWHDVQCNWDSLSSIIDHFGNHSVRLQAVAGPGRWNDADMLLVGAGCLTLAEERTQMALWSLLASPLIMGNDARKIRAASRAILLNKPAIAISQDPLGTPGVRLWPPALSRAKARHNNQDEQPREHELWARNLTGGDVAVGLYNKGTAANTSASTFTVDLAALGFGASATVQVFDCWAGTSAGKHRGKYTSPPVAHHDTLLLRLSRAS